jgi:hypothetical protein
MRGSKCRKIRKAVYEEASHLDRTYTLSEPSLSGKREVHADVKRRGYQKLKKEYWRKPL